MIDSSVNIKVAAHNYNTSVQRTIAEAPDASRSDVAFPCLVVNI